MDVRLPDGTIIRGVPDGMSKAELTAKLKANGYDVSGLEDAAPEKTFGQKAKQFGADVLGGAVRGAASIGATLTTPVTRFDRKTGAPDARGFLDKRRDTLREVDAGLTSAIGSNAESMPYAGGKLLSEIAGTLGVGGALSRGAAMLPGAARMSPLIDAIGSAGFKAGGAVGAPALAARTAGGAITGAAAAGLVDPSQAGMGALIGGVLPGAMQGTGAVGRKVGEVIRGPGQSADMVQAIQQARGAGYVIPPTQAKPTLTNRVMEGLSGKITTAQNASARNQETTGRLTAKALGLADDTKLTPEVLDAVRKEAGEVYGRLAALPARPAVAANTLSNTPASPAIKPAAMVFDLRKARNDATAWYRSYGRTADPDALVKAKAAAAKAKEIESTLEGYAQSLGLDDLLPELREARTRIAKTYSVEAALNPTTGAVDARKLAGQLAKGKPLSGELKQAAEFAARFPKAAQTVEGMGSLPQTSPLDWIPAGALSMATSNPLMMLGVGARPAARALSLSPLVQNRLVQGQPNALQALMMNPELAQLGYRAAPNALIGR
jgi:hypothetical protein